MKSHPFSFVVSVWPFNFFYRAIYRATTFSLYSLYLPLSGPVTQ